MEAEFSQIFVAAFIRVLAGVLFLFQGYDKLFNIGMKATRAAIETNLTRQRIPSSLVGLIVTYTSWIELIGGALLVTGLFTHPTVYLLCINILIVTIGFSMAKAMWENTQVYVRLILLIFLLLIPPSWNVFSIDQLLGLHNLQP